MPGCATCRHRKVKCDGRSGTCVRCEKLGVTCRWTVQTDDNAALNLNDQDALTQAGYKRLRTSVACDPCRRRKAKCDALRPSCGSCMRLKSQCSYDGIVIYPGQPSENGSPERGVHRRTDSGDRTVENTSLGREDLFDVPSSVPTISSQPPSGSALLPYIDAFLQNVHPVGCNNFLHGGLLGEALEKAPRMLLLALCGITAKFTAGESAQEQGRLWIEEARLIVLKRLGNISTLTVTVLQFLATHDIQEGNLTSAWNLIGIAVRMALQLKLNRPSGRYSSEIESSIFLSEECHGRLMWSVFVSDSLCTFDESQASEEAVADLPLPCNIWNFTQGTPCTTLTLSQISDPMADTILKQATNPCAYLIKILAIRRKIMNFVNQQSDIDAVQAWREDSYFQTLCSELETWRHSLPANFAFEERNMFTFRASCHLDIFLMIHIWYHQSQCELYGGWIPGHAGSLPIQSTTPGGFVQDCRERALSHARGISQLIKKIMKVEPDHLFRDAWFGLCVLDSTRIQIVGLEGESGHAYDKLKGNLIQTLNLHLRALNNTRKIFPLAEKSYSEACMIIQRGGLAEAVGLNVHDEAFVDEVHRSKSEIAFYRRYPFLEAEPIADLTGWDELFNAANAGSIAATRDLSLDPPTQAMRQEPRADQTFPNFPGIPHDISGELFSTPWPSVEFEWPAPNTTQGAISVNDAQALEGSLITRADHNMLEFSVDSFAHPH